MYRPRSGVTGWRLVVFFIVAAVLAFLIAKLLAFVLHLVFVVAGYLIAFALAAALLLWLFGRIRGGNSNEGEYDRARDASGRRRW